jgi:hypothetical protein
MKYSIKDELEQILEMLVSDREIAVENGENKIVTLLNNYIGDLEVIINDKEEVEPEPNKSSSEVDELLIDLLIQTVDEYNELQEDEAKRLDWWEDVVNNISDTSDEREIERVIATIKNEIKKLK